MDGVIIAIIVIVFLFLIILSNLSLYLCFYYRPPNPQNPQVVQVPLGSSCPSAPPDPPPPPKIVNTSLNPSTQEFTCPPDKPILIDGQCHPSPPKQSSKMPYSIYR